MSPNRNESTRDRDRRPDESSGLGDQQGTISPSDLAALNERFPMRAGGSRPATAGSRVTPGTHVGVGVGPDFGTTSISSSAPRPRARASASQRETPPASPLWPSSSDNQYGARSTRPDLQPKRSRFGQYELQPIPARSEPRENTTQGAVDSVEGENKSNTGDPNALPKIRSGADDPNAKSIRHAIKARFENARAEKRRKKIGGGTLSDRMKDQFKVFYQKTIVETILRRKPLPPTRNGRHVPLNPSDTGSDGLIDERSRKPYITNFIRSSRYTIWDFVPAQIIYQFSKLGNFYFLVMGILQLVPGLSTIGQYTTIAPLLVFVAFSMAKEGYDDYRRYQLDKTENRSKVLVLAHGIRRNQSRPAESTKRPKKSVFKSRRKGTESPDTLTPGSVEAGNGYDGSRQDHEWLTVQWQQVQVGDVIRLHRDEPVPADIVLLHATGPNGIAYIETMALDGETNLKSKQACPLLSEHCKTVEGLKTARAVIVSEDPNLDLYSYDGRVTANDETVPLSINNVVYRGSTLRNTAQAIGLVINSGEECKIRMNANKNVTAKKPAMQSSINKMVLIQIFIVVMLAVGLTIGYSLWSSEIEDHAFFLVSPGLYDASVPYKEIFFGFLIMFNTLIPLSLYISLEIVKLGQLFLLQDAEMYDPASNTPMVANTTTILENLGQVSYVFSDKTGTLTENIMRFRKMSVAGVACLHDMDMERDEQAKLDKARTVDFSSKSKQAVPARFDNDGNIGGIRPPPRAPGAASGSRWRSSVRPDDVPEMKTETLIDHIRRKPNTAFSIKAKHFLLCIALCHTCLPEEKEDGKIEYQAASPDELALIEAARDFGYVLIDRPAHAIHLQTTDTQGNLCTETYEVLDVIEFSSKRKRMTIIIRMPDGRICVFCKGADNVIMDRLRLSELAKQKAKDVSRRASVMKSSEQGREYRRMSAHITSAQSSPRNSVTLRNRDSLSYSVGRRSADLNRWSQAAAIAAWLNRRNTQDMMSPRQSIDVFKTPRQSLSQKPSHETMDRMMDDSMADDAAIMEKCFKHTNDFASEGLRTLLYGYCYIEGDAYAEWKAIYREAETSLVNRQERIEAAAEKIERGFELAGATAIEDKLQDGVPETIDKLRRARIKVWMLTGDKRETAINIGHSARVCKPFSEIYILDSTEGNLRDTMTVMLNDVSRGLLPHCVVVVDGGTLATIDADEDLSVLFYDLVVRVDSVICCRASPSQKAGLVNSIRRYVPESMTLAIGDGANDIGMIQASHVGIGVSGREGLQAARISDYSIAQFRFLQKLLFVHGRWNYLRTGKYVLSTFWKEMLFFLVQGHYQRSNGYTGTSLFESKSLTVFNTLFTSLPVILIGIFERDLRAETLLEVPELYTFGQDNLGFSFPQYFGWMTMGATGSVISYYFMWAIYLNVFGDQDDTIYALGVVCFTIGVIFINIKLL